MTGVKSVNFDQSSFLDEIIGHSDGSLVRAPASLVRAQFAAEPLGPNCQNRADLYADLAWADGATATVWGDATEAWRGVYRKSGASGAGSWARIGDLPMSSASSAQLNAKAPLASPALTGVPTAPTAAPGTNTMQLANTAFVQAALAALIEAAPGALDTLNELAAALGDDPNFAATVTTALAGKAPLASPALTGTPTAPTAAPGTNSTQLANTAFVQTALAALVEAAPGALNTLNELAAALGDDPNFAATVTAALAGKAPLASPALTGVPTAPTAAPGTDSAQIANTAFVRAALDALVSAAPGALDTLNELAAALGDDPNFAGSVTAALASNLAQITDEAARAMAAEALIGAGQRPGDLASAYGAQLTGGVADTSPADGTDVVIDPALGAAIRLTTATHLAPRAPVALEPGRVYLARWAARRAVDPADPLGDAIAIGLRWLAADLTGIAGGDGSVVVEEIPLTEAMGRVMRGATLSLDVAGTDVTAPAAARYARPWLQAYGTDHQTLAGRVDLIDVTEAWLAHRAADASVQPADIAADLAKLSGIQSGATANATDAALRDRASHTGAQPITTVTGLSDALTGLSQARIDGDAAEAAARAAAIGAEATTRASAVAALQAADTAERTARETLQERAGVMRLARGVLGGLMGSDGRELLRLLHDRGTRRTRVDGHVLDSDLGALRIAPRGVMTRLLGGDGREIIAALWDRQAQRIRWAGHALQTDLGALRIAPRGIMARLLGSDGRALLDLQWDRAAQTPRWAGHALLADMGAQDYPALAAPGDRLAVAPASARAVAGEIVVQTRASGFGWARLPRALTPHLVIDNASGTTLQIRRGWGLKIVGQRLIGAYDPGAVASLTDRGAFTTTLPAPGGYAEGDFLEQSASAGNTVGGTVYAQGDLAVIVAGAWVRQACPAGGDLAGDFWTVSAPGVFGGIVLATGDRLVQITRQVGSGAYDRRWARADRALGDICLMGETATPAAAPPATPSDGDLWQVTAPDGAYAEHDGLLRRAGAWLRLPSDPVQSIATGAALFLRAEGATDAWELRRADKATTVAAATASILRETVRPVTTTRDLYCLSDSMFGFVTGALAAAMPTRAVTVAADGGATSYTVLANLERVIREGEPYADRIHIAWHGQNNAGLYGQINEVNDRIAALLAGRRLLLMSVLGQYTCTYSSGRIVVVPQEFQRPGYQPTYSTRRVVDHLLRQHPDALFDTRAELCAAAGDAPALLWPGMTEAEVAEAYGIVPLSFFLNLAAMPWSPGALTFQGYRAEPGLPTGGSDLDYVIRSAADGASPVGQIIVREAGIWVARSIADTVHLTTAAGQQALAARISLKLTEKGW